MSTFLLYSYKPQNISFHITNQDILISLYVILGDRKQLSQPNRFSSYCNTLLPIGTFWQKLLKTLAIKFSFWQN